VSVATEVGKLGVMVAMLPAPDEWHHMINRRAVRIGPFGLQVDRTIAELAYALVALDEDRD
jgi:hypothetical protein